MSIRLYQKIRRHKEPIGVEMSCMARSKKGVRRSGWLHKRGGRIQTWHKRWFVLTGDMIFYHKNPQDNRPTGTIPLAGNKVIRHTDDPKQLNSFKFEIVAGSDRRVITSTHESYLISADSAEEADEWVAAINRVMHEPYGGGMFGRCLEETMQVEKRLGGTYVPVLVHRCAKFIEENGMDEVGIFRLPGQASRIQAMKELYDQGSQKDFVSTEDVHTVASLLKLYLRELPEPVIPFVFYESFCKVTKMYDKDPEAAVDELMRLLIQLPKSTFNLLKYLTRFLNKVKQRSERNKMNSRNLGMIFGPNILRSNIQSTDHHVLMESSNIAADFVMILISRAKDFFPITLDERPPKRLSIVKTRDDFSSHYNWQENKMQHSVFGMSASGRTGSPIRPRKNTAPTALTTSSQAGLDSSNKKFEVISIIPASSFRRYSRLLSSPSPTPSPPSEGEPKEEGTISPLAVNDLSTQRSDSCSPPCDGDGDEAELTDLIKRLSYLSEVPQVQKSDTISSDIIVNSISTELETLEKQLYYAREEAAKNRKAARLWKTRYEQEKRARLAAEERVKDLQGLIDETFSQFALDDSEDDFEDDSPSPDQHSLCNGESSIDRDTSTATPSKNSLPAFRKTLTPVESEV